ncbi:phosphoglycerate dehydrogenase [Arcticibacterium luteifluviistationis]|uniref:D-3-phosphoglycerate dehydrogenase n=1 Tax=Arcticibacterium luteifluviistationis TaxID=1784714 RepID=A0A2Z4GDG2_9BACT|nr:phosphoglycerate dehydrogenase [Arcticibacterium luteifluviistationis]AWV99048.1 phosphoglycerate dehydrogenase [Arcticibacterium luteifluviistationis]
MASTTPKKYFIIDFDSTFTKVEGLDELAKIALNGSPNQEETVAEIKRLTDLGMSGELTFAEALSKRLALLSANKTHIDELVSFLKDNISDSFARNEVFFEHYADEIIILSSGFKDFIVPVATGLGVKEENIYANTFTFDAEGNITGADTENVLAGNGGKVKLVKSLKLDGEVHVIGDGFTDYEIRQSGLAEKFYAFTENVKRNKVVAVADEVVKSLDEILWMNHMPRSQSYPKSRIKILLLENVHQAAVSAFKKEGFDVDFHVGALDGEELLEKIKDASIVGLRSKTMLTAEVLEHAEKLIAVGAFCIGTNQIDLEKCTEMGVAVFNAPYSNTRSVVELAIAEMIMLIRKIPSNSERMHKGVWNKSATNSFEIRGKKLGLIGYGHIGMQLSVVAEAMGMEVHFYDATDKMPIGNAIKCRSMEEVFAVSDVVSLHIDGRPENNDLITAKEFAQMKDGVIFLNLARGFVVDIPSLVDALKSGKIAGAGVDVFPKEPKTNKEPFVSELMGMENVILSPHIGGSTEEAQEMIGHYVPERLLEYMNNGSTTGSVNFPEVQLPMLGESHRLMHIHKNVPGIMAKINSLCAKYDINVSGQYLKTNETIGYVIMDVSRSYSPEFLEELREIDNTIKFRKLF